VTVGGDEPTPEFVSRVEAAHWRAVAEEKSSELTRLKRRPVVRIALAIDRRIEPGRRAIADRWRAGRALKDRAALAIAARTSGTPLAIRRASLSAAIAQLEPAPKSSRAVSMVTSVDEARAATGDLLCFALAPVDALDDGWLDRLAAAIDGDAVAATPTLVHPERPAPHATEHDLRVRTEGFDIEAEDSGAPIAIAGHAGEDVDVTGAITEVAAAPLRFLVVDRGAYVASGGIGTVDDEDVAGIELSARLRERGGRIVHVPSAVLYDTRPVRSRAALQRPIDVGRPAWRRFVEHNGPAATRASCPRWVITTAVPSAKIAHRWGDWHLAEALARALRQLGQEVEVQTHDSADSLPARSRDIHLVLHGLARVRRTPGQRHIIWVISHPESLDIADCDAADLVLVASTPFADQLRTRTSTPVEVMHQATDPDRFCPGPPDPAFQHPVTVVAKTRGVMRPVVADALAAGIRPAIYGGGWRGLVDPSLVVSDHVDNDVLPAVYRSAGVVLNDHWDTMRAWGFVSNRLFDVLACGTPVISDDLPQIREVLGDTVPTYMSSDELGDLVRAALHASAEARALAASGREIVLAEHTFEHRARQLLALIEQYGLATGGP
jgi:hypothetical protein